jgi:hypothetical protein
MSDEADIVKELLRALRERSMSLEEVAQCFRERTWPSTRPPEPTSYLEMAAQEMQDPETDVPGSFDDVVAAYDRGELTEHEFDTLAEAVAESIRAKHSRE